MAQRVVGIIMNGVTGRMGMNQHLIRSILAIRAQGGLTVAGGDTIWPEPLLVGRSEDKLAKLAGRARARALDDRPRRARSPIPRTRSTSTRS